MRLVSKALRFLLASDLSTRDLKMRLANAAGVDEQTAARIIIKAKAERARVLVASAEKKILFLPQCLRAKGCRASLTEEGYRCQACRSDCMIAQLKALTRMSTYIVPGGALVRTIIERERPDGVVGIACVPEIEMALDYCAKAGIPAVGIPLLKDGCVATLVDIEEAARMLRSCDGSSTDKH